MIRRLGVVPVPGTGSTKTQRWVSDGDGGAAMEEQRRTLVVRAQGPRRVTAEEARGPREVRSCSEWNRGCYRL